MSEPIPACTSRQFTAILPDDQKCLDSLRALLDDELGLVSYVTHRCRGALPGCPVDHKGVPLWREMVILELVVPEDRAEAVFFAIYTTALADRTDGGLLLMGRAHRNSLSPPTADQMVP